MTITDVLLNQKTLLSEKDICDPQNISIKLPCVCVCLSSGDLFHFFGKSFLFLFFFFVLSILRYFPFHMVYKILLLDFVDTVFNEGQWWITHLLGWRSRGSDESQCSNLVIIIWDSTLISYLERSLARCLKFFFLLTIQSAKLNIDIVSKHHC